MATQKIHKLFKVVTAGEGAVGKTTFLHRFTSNTFVENLKITIGVQFFSKHIEIEGKIYQIVVWDFGGQDQFRDLLSVYISGTAGALFLVDLTNLHRSLINIKDWWETLNKEKEIPIILIGAKYDLIDRDAYKKQRKTIDEILEKYNFIGYKKTSSKTGLNVRFCVEELVKRLV